MSETSAPNDSSTVSNAETFNTQMSNISQTLSSWIGEQKWVPESLSGPLAILILLTGVLIVSSLIYFVFRPLVLRAVTSLTNKSKTSWDNQLMGHGVFRWLTHLLPGIFIYLSAPGLFESAPAVLKLSLIHI